MDTRQAKIEALKAAQMGQNPFINQRKYWIFHDQRILRVNEDTMEVTEKTAEKFAQLNGPEDFCTWPMGEVPPEYIGQGTEAPSYESCITLIRQTILLKNFKP